MRYTTTCLSFLFLSSHLPSPPFFSLLFYFLLYDLLLSPTVFPSRPLYLFHYFTSNGKVGTAISHSVAPNMQCCPILIKLPGATVFYFNASISPPITPISSLICFRICAFLPYVLVCISITFNLVQFHAILLFLFSSTLKLL